MAAILQKKFEGNTGIVLTVTIVGLIIYGTDAGKLGMYWDDSSLLLHALQRAQGDVVRFIFTDATTFLTSERPLAYFAHLLCRAGFSVSLSLTHWISVVFIILNAIVVVIVANRILDSNWFSFAAGIVFLSYPMAPLQAIWPTLLQYLWASLLTLLSIWSFLRGLDTRGNEQVRYFVFAAFLYFAAIITHETFILLPPIFVSFYVLSTGGSKGTCWKLVGPVRISHPSALCLALFLAVVAGYSIWREITLPSYGGQLYPTSSTTLQHPATFISQFLTGVRTFFVPLDEVMQQLQLWPPPLRYLSLSLILFLVVWVVIVRLRSLEAREQGALAFPWARTTICGTALTLGGITILAFSPAWVVGVVGAGFYSRVNFVVVIGVAFAVPALLGLIISPSYRFNLFAGLLCILYIFYTGFTSSYLDIGSLYPSSNPSSGFAVYSLKHQLAILAYLIALILLILLVVLSSVLTRSPILKLPKNKSLERLWFHISTQFVAAAVALLVLFGSLFHFSTKAKYIIRWDEHKSLLAQLHKLAPALKENTFVVIVRDRTDPVSPSHYEWSSFLVALYGDRSIMGNTNWQLRFYPEGVESTYYGKRVNRAKKLISYDRILLFDFDGRTLRMLPRLKAINADGRPIVVLNNPERILPGPPVKTLVSRYLR